MAILHQAAAYCRKLTERSKSNFYYAFLFLSTERRRALEAVYAYCRLVDDVVDEEATKEAKEAGLVYWRGQLAILFGDADESAVELHAVTSELKSVVERFGVRRQDLEAIIDGCEMDIDARRYATWDELRTYCYRVASAVGLMCVRIFGAATPDVDRYAVDLGIALQLTNILRDVAEDARRGRVYLPTEDLESFGVDENELVSGVRSVQFVRLMRFEAARARSHYFRARAQIGPTTKRQLVIAEIMGDIYYALLLRLEADDFDVFGERATVPRHRKMAIALGKFIEAKLLPQLARA